MLVVLCVWRGVVVVMVVVGRGVLLGLDVLGVVTVELGLCYGLCCVMEVGRVGLVGDEGGVTGWRK